MTGGSTTSGICPDVQRRLVISRWRIRKAKLPTYLRGAPCRRPETRSPPRCDVGFSSRRIPPPSSRGSKFNTIRSSGGDFVTSGGGKGDYASVLLEPVLQLALEVLRESLLLKSTPNVSSVVLSSARVAGVDRADARASSVAREPLRFFGETAALRVAGFLAAGFGRPPISSATARASAWPAPATRRAASRPASWASSACGSGAPASPSASVGRASASATWARPSWRPWACAPARTSGPCRRR